MDNETSPNDNESEVVETSEAINENGCNELHNVDNTTIQTDDKNDADQLVDADTDAATKETNPIETDRKDSDESCLTTKELTPSDEPEVASELEPIESEQIQQSDNLSEKSPEKVISQAGIISSPSELDLDVQSDEKNWNQMNDSSPDKHRSETACLIPSPSDVDGDDSINEKGRWYQLSEVDGVYEDSMDAADSDVDTEPNNRTNSKVERKPAVDCPVFELTDDNSSIEARSEGDDDIEDEEMGEEDEEENESGKSI